MENQTPASPRSLGTEDLRSGLLPQMSAWEAFKFGFRGPGLINLLVGLVMFFIPIVGMIIFNGWLAATSRRLVKGDEPAVEPFSLDHLGDYLKSGTVVFIPQLVVGVLMSVVFMMVVFGTSMVGTIIAGLIESPAIGGLFTLLSMVLMMVIMLVGSAFLLGIQTRAELSGDLKVAFDFQATLNFVRRNLVAMLVHAVVLGLMLVPAMFAGTLVFFIGLYVVVAAAQFMYAHLRAQVYVTDVANGGEQIPIFDGPGAAL